MNSNEILFHYGKILEGVAKGQTKFAPVAIEIHPTAMCKDTDIPDHSIVYGQHPRLVIKTEQQKKIEAIRQHMWSK